MVHSGEGCDDEGEEGTTEWALRNAVRQSGGEQGIVSVPVALLWHAGLDPGCEVNLVGRGSYFEVWCPEHFRHVSDREMAMLDELDRELELPLPTLRSCKLDMLVRQLRRGRGPDLIGRWRRGACYERRTVVRILKARRRDLMRHPIAVETLMAVIGDSDEQVRAEAVDALIAIGTDEDWQLGPALMIEALRAPILWFYTDPHELHGYDVDLRDGIRRALADMAERVARDGVAIAAIEAGLKGSDAEHRRACARLLEELGGKVLDQASVAVLVVDALLNWDPAVRELACRTLGWHGSVNLIRTPELERLLELVRQHGPEDVQGVLDALQPAPGV
jgi:hypothetical protein